MKKTQSIKLQEQAGTLERNKAIKWRWIHGESQAEMGRQYKISRQAINIICHRKDSDQTYLEKPQNQRQGSLLTKLIGCLLGR